MGIKRGVNFEDDLYEQLEKHSEKAKSFSQVVNDVLRLGLKDYAPSERVALKKELHELMKEEKMLRKLINAVKRSGAYAMEHLENLAGGETEVQCTKSNGLTEIKDSKPKFRRHPKRFANPTHLPESDEFLVDAPEQEIRAVGTLLIRLEEVVERVSEIVEKLYPECWKRLGFRKDEKDKVWRILVDDKEIGLKDRGKAQKELTDALKDGLRGSES